MKCSEAGITIIKSFESCRLHAYKDIVGIWTCGYGSTGADIHEGLVWTQEQADERFLQDLSVFEDGISDALEVECTGNQFSALCSFAYNLGLHALLNSHLFKYVNAGDADAAAGEFHKWSNAGGVQVPGLLRRRLAERTLFLS